MESFNFNELPEVVRRLFEKVEHIESILEKIVPKEHEPDWMTIEEAAAFLKVSVGSIYNRVNRRELPVSKPGKRLYFSRKALSEWVRSGQLKTQQEIEKEARGYASIRRTFR